MFWSFSGHFRWIHLCFQSQLQSAAVMFSQQRDAAWLSQVHMNDKPVEWAGFGAQQDWLAAGSAQKLKTLVVFGPMIDSPPARPDTVITTLMYIQRTLNSLGCSRPPTVSDCMPSPMERASVLDERHTSPGYDACSHEFPGLYRNTDDASGVDILIGAAFAGITSIVNGKAWANALRAYRLIIAVLLQNFYSSGAKTYAELCVYLETAREHPTGRLWMDCLIKPTQVCRSVWRADIYQAREGFWRYEGHFNEHRASGCVRPPWHCHRTYVQWRWEEQKPHGGADGEEKNKHKEEGEGRRRLDEADRRKITVELEKYIHPLNDQQPGVYNICNGQVATNTVNVQNAGSSPLH